MLLFSGWYWLGLLALQQLFLLVLTVLIVLWQNRSAGSA